jgi:hypothetical protein
MTEYKPFSFIWWGHFNTDALMTGTSVENQDSHPVAKAYGSLGEN